MESLNEAKSDVTRIWIAEHLEIVRPGGTLKAPLLNDQFKDAVLLLSIRSVCKNRHWIVCGYISGGRQVYAQNARCGLAVIGKTHNSLRKNNSPYLAESHCVSDKRIR